VTLDDLGSTGHPVCDMSYVQWFRRYTFRLSLAGTWLVRPRRAGMRSRPRVVAVAPALVPATSARRRRRGRGCNPIPAPSDHAASSPGSRFCPHHSFSHDSFVYSFTINTAACRLSPLVSASHAAGFYPDILSVKILIEMTIIAVYTAASRGFHRDSTALELNNSINHGKITVKC